MASITLFLFFFLCYFELHSAEYSTDQNLECPRSSFSCGKLGEIRFPYTTSNLSHCGMVVIDGCDKDTQRVQFEKEGRWYDIHNIRRGDEIFIHDQLLSQNLSSGDCKAFNNLGFPTYPYMSFQVVNNLTMFKCGHNVSLPSLLEYGDCRNFTIYYPPDLKNLQSLHSECPVIQLPAQQVQNNSDIFARLTSNFSLKVQVSPPCYRCHYRGGYCETDRNGKFHCSNSKGDHVKVKTIVIGTAASATGALILLIAYLKRRFFSNIPILYGNNKSHDFRNIDAFLKSHGPLAVKRYKYSEIKRMTKSFKDKLGEGGFGGVFKGKLPDGGFVAVKLLKESKGNGDEFINEVASISRTSHVHIVTLLGFCFEGSKRALVYEFMPNGSLEKYTHRDNPSTSTHKLGWGTLFEIAVGIARGLEYLHRGCNTRILHLDIKPHNILLDENFFPKISDFGLSKICTRKESILSLTDPRGTAGYIAPEVFCRNFGEVSHKSDVYSYGMLVLEMVGGRRNICVSVDQTSQIYFPDWIFKRLELGNELGFEGISNEEDNKMARKMVVVSLWCIQTNPSHRPPVSRVVEMLQATLESLPIPPKPYLSSPSRSPRTPTASSSTTSIA